MQTEKTLSDPEQDERQVTVEDLETLFKIREESRKENLNGEENNG